MRWPRRNRYPAQQIVALPDALAVGADYGLTVMNGAGEAAKGLPAFIMSPEGQKIPWVTASRQAK